VEKVHKISIIPRGRALGYTLNLPEEDRYLKSKDELLDHLVVLLGGRVAEHVVFGAITTGASDDLKRVYDISRAMVAEYGMGTELMSRRLPPDDYSVSDATRRTLDDEQQHITDLAYRRAQAMILEHRSLLDAFAARLLDKEVLERNDIERIVARYRTEAAQAEIAANGKSSPTPVAAAERKEPEAPAPHRYEPPEPPQ
jgi:cell division protease FtsH